MLAPATERRAAPRFGMDFHAELASGDGPLRVKIWDVSMTGCALRVMDQTVSSLDASAKGLLIFKLQGDEVSTMLPISIINVRFDSGSLCYGSLFRVLSQRQKRNLIRLIDENTLQVRWRRAS